MKQVLQNLSNGETLVTEVPAPAATAQHLLVQSRKTLISAGTEKMLVEFGQAGWIGKAKAQPEKVKQVLDKIRTDGLLPTLDAVFSKLGEPLPLGYCNAGLVTHVGSQVTGFEVGDRVVSNGAHADIVSVPPRLCAKIPDNVSDDEAAFTVLASIGLQGVRLAKPTLGETVVVYGLGLIGLVTVQLLRANGCRVIGIDINPGRLQLAQQFGADTIHGGECADVPAKIATMTSMRGADAVLITASAKSDAIISSSAKMCRKRGRVILVGVVGLNLNRSDFYEKEISFQVSCSYGPGRYDAAYEQQGQDYPLGYVRWTEQRNFEAILQMLSAGNISFKQLITHHFELDRASEAYATIQQDSGAMAVLLEYPDQVNSEQTVRISRSNDKRPPDAQLRTNPSEVDFERVGSVVGAVVGAGNFTRATLMPALKGLPLRMKYVVGRTGGSAVQHVAHKFSVEHATTDLSVVLDDPQVNLVMITTNHDSHASLVCQALSAGKHVFVEKPLALNVQELRSVAAAVAAHPKQLLMVGFNRRFSPHTIRCEKLLSGRASPIAANIMVNAGDIPADHWVHDDRVGGGRIIGEACHFIDLLVHLTGSPVRSISAQRMGGTVAVHDDKMAIAVSLADGSVASINYFANGSKSFPKESISLFSDNRVLTIGNFRKTIGYGFPSFRKLKTLRPDKGHRQQFAALIKAVSETGQGLIPFGQLSNVTLASFAAVTSAREERTVEIPECLNGVD